MNSLLGYVGLLATLVSVIVQILKGVLPQSFPTQLLTLIVSLITTVLAVIVFGGVTLTTILGGIFGSFVVAFVSMNGFDTLKDLFTRYKYKGGE